MQTQCTTRAHMLTPREKRDILRDNIARLLMDGEMDCDASREIGASAQAAYLADARLAQRIRDPQAYAVAVDHACRRYAYARGWDWPDLAGYAPAEGDVMLARAEMRQHIRYWVHVAILGFVQHLRDGRAEHEAAALKRIRAERASDELTRRTMKPKPSLSVVKGGAK